MSNNTMLKKKWQGDGGTGHGRFVNSGELYVVN